MTMTKVLLGTVFNIVMCAIIMTLCNMNANAVIEGMELMEITKYNDYIVLAMNVAGVSLCAALQITLQIGRTEIIKARMKG